MHRPELVILDEPSTGLDPLVQQEFHNLVNEVVADGRTVFLSSHTLSEVERVADRVGIIRHGKLVEVSTTERTVLLAVVAASVASMTIVVSLMFDGLQDTMADLSKDLPENVARLFGGGDLGTAVGWIDAELVSPLLPLVFIGVAVNMGVAAIAGEAGRHTLALLFSAPIRRRRAVAEKASALAAVVLVIGIASGLSILAGSAVGGLGLSTANIAGTTAHLILIGLFFGMVALAIGSATAKPMATRTTVSLAVVSYLIASLFPVSAALAPWAKISPWHYYNSSSPLANGADSLHLLILTVLTAVAFAAALVLVDRRDVAA